MSSPFFSIIIPVFNVKDYLEKCVQSVTSQSFDNFEIIIIDDGSSDGSEKICDKLAQNDNRIKIIHKKNEGVAVARNTGIAKAVGEYILFLDSDDTFSPNLLENISNKISKTNADIIVFGYKRITENGKVLRVSYPKEDCTLEFMMSKIKDLPFLLWAKSYKKTLFNALDLNAIRGITFSEDSYLALALQKQAKSTEFISDTGYNYLCRKTSVTQNMSEKNHLDRIKAVKLIDSLYNNESEKPPILNEIKFNTKFFYIDPNCSYVKGKFFKNCKVWRKTFPESNFYKSSELKTIKMKVYVFFIRLHFDLIAYILYRISNIDFIISLSQIFKDL